MFYIRLHIGYTKVTNKFNILDINKTKMTILNHGTRIRTVVGHIDGFVTGVSIRGNTTLYEISYLCSGEFKSSWLYRFEIEPQAEKKQAGFNYESDVKLLK